jgi:hypothetical protein
MMARSGAVHIPSNTEKRNYMHSILGFASILTRGESIVSSLFQFVDLWAYMICIHNSSNGNATNKDSGELVAKPTKFLNDNRFPSWNRKLTNYIGNKMGKTGTTLSYVIREDDAVPSDAVLTPDHPTKQIMALCGDCYMSTSWNGCEAFKALVVHYEGATQQSRSDQAAYVIIEI